MLVAHSPANKEIRELGSILHRCNLALTHLPST